MDDTSFLRFSQSFIFMLWVVGIEALIFPVALGAAFQPLSPLSKKKGTRREAKFPLIIQMVPKGGLEPPRVTRLLVSRSLFQGVASF